jgi:hypothetical protein
MTSSVDPFLGPKASQIRCPRATFATLMGSSLHFLPKETAERLKLGPRKVLSKYHTIPCKDNMEKEKKLGVGPQIFACAVCARKGRAIEGIAFDRPEICPEEQGGGRSHVRAPEARVEPRSRRGP